MKDFKINQATSTTVVELIEWIKISYGTIGEVKITCGRKKHNFLSIKIDNSNKGQVYVDMIDYVRSMIEFFLHEQLIGERDASLLKFIDTFPSDSCAISHICCRDEISAHAWKTRKRPALLIYQQESGILVRMIGESL